MIIDNSKLNQLIHVIATQSEYKFHLYTKKSLSRRIAKSLGEFQLSIDGLIKKIEHDKEFLETFVKYITVNTTEFYRDTATWKWYENYLQNFSKRKKTLNIWHIGCSIGFEVYSNLTLLNNYGLLSNAGIYATDINSDVLEIAQKGVYKYVNIPEFKENYNNYILQTKGNNHVPIDNYFDINEEESVIEVKDVLLNKVIFKKHDILSQTNPFDVSFDIIFARNILIYFNQDVQDEICNFFYNNLNIGGYFIVGRYEAISSDISEKFTGQDVIYKKR